MVRTSGLELPPQAVSSIIDISTASTDHSLRTRKTCIPTACPLDRFGGEDSMLRPGQREGNQSSATMEIFGDDIDDRSGNANQPLGNRRGDRTGDL